MKRRWLRNSPHLPGNPIGRGVILLRDLEGAAEEAGARAKPHWRDFRSRGMTANQAAHARDTLGAWEQLSSEERARMRQQFEDEGGLTPAQFKDLRLAAMLARWVSRVRETNGSLAALETRIEERRAHVAYLEEIAANINADEADIYEAQEHADGAEEEVAILMQRCRTLQSTVINEIFVACVDVFPDLMRRLLVEGVFLVDEVREFRGFRDAMIESVPVPE